MYNTSHKDKDVTEPPVRNEISSRNLSSIRQHLFSRDSFSIHIDFDIAEETMDLTAALQKITSSSTLGNATFSSCQFSKAENVSSGSVNKESVFNVVEKLCQTVRPEAESCLNKSAITEKMGECAISGGGDASLIMESCQKLSSVRPPNNKIQKSTSEQHELIVGERRRRAGSARSSEAREPSTFPSRSKSVRRTKHGRRGDKYVGSAAGRGRDRVRGKDMPQFGG